MLSWYVFTLPNLYNSRSFHVEWLPGCQKSCSAMLLQPHWSPALNSSNRSSSFPVYRSWHFTRNWCGGDRGWAELCNVGGVHDSGPRPGQRWALSRSWESCQCPHRQTAAAVAYQRQYCHHRPLPGSAGQTPPPRWHNITITSCHTGIVRLSQCIW